MNLHTSIDDSLNTPKKKGRPKSTTTSKAVAPRFLALCKEGLSLTQISAKLEVPRETFERWYRERKHNTEFAKAFEQGKTAWQAYHETLLQEMISGSRHSSAAEISAQQFVLRTQFRSEWTDKQDAKVEVSHVTKLTDNQLEEQILNLLNKNQVKSYISSKEDLKLVVNDSE